MLGSIKYNLSHLADFQGRDGRQTFWYYILFIVIARIAIGIGLAIPMIGGAMGQAITAAKSGVVDQQALTASVVSQMAPWIPIMAYVSIGVGVVTILLLMAALVRRLHDSNKSGWWALIPLLAEIVALWVSYRAIDRMDVALNQAMQQIQSGGMIQHQQEASALRLMGWVAIIAVIVFGIMKSTEGPNRYGETPVQF